MVTARLHSGWRRRGACLVLLLISSILLSACVEVELGSEYRADGSASHSIQIQVDFVPSDREDVEDMEAMLGDLQERAENSGLDYERTDESGSVIVRITGTTSEGQEAGAALNSLINATGISASPGVAAPFRGTFHRGTGAIGGSSYTLDLSVDGELLFETVVMERLSDTTVDSEDAVTMRYVASFPGDVTSTSGTKLDDRTVVWDIPFDRVTELTITARTGGPGSAALFVVAGAAVAVGILAVAIFFGWYFARRRRLNMTLGAAIHRLPGQQTITREGIWVARKISGFTRRLQGGRREPPEPEP